MNSDNEQHQPGSANLSSLDEGNASGVTNITRTSIESLVPDFGGESTKVVIVEGRQRLVRARIAGFLALGLWIIFGGVIIWHLWSVGDLSRHLLSDATSLPEGAEQHFDQAIALIGDTAKTLYAILGPLITAATSFYFTESAASRNISGDGAQNSLI